MSVNKIMLCGNLGKDPEISESKNNMKIAKFSIAVAENKETVQWFNIVAFGKQAEFAESYLKKGSLVFIDGKLQISQYEKNGENRYFTNIIANSFSFVGNSKSNQNENKTQPSLYDEDIPF